MSPKERYVALLRGVSPMNCKMPELKHCFESAGFSDVKTLLSSGNVAFSSTPDHVTALEAHVEAAMAKHLHRVFQTIVRPSALLQSIVAADPFAEFELPATSKRVVTFLRQPHQGQLELPVVKDAASILRLVGTEAYTAYVPNEKGPLFMSLLERTFGTEITTRTWDTVKKCAAA